MDFIFDIAGVYDNSAFLSQFLGNHWFVCGSTMLLCRFQQNSIQDCGESSKKSELRLHGNGIIFEIERWKTTLWAIAFLYVYNSMEWKKFKAK